MWVLLKTMIGVLLVGALAYGVFFVDMGGQSMAGHIADIWRAPVVQRKIEAAREGMKKRLEERLAKAGAEAGRETAGQLTGPGDHLTAQDREDLEEVLDKVAGP